MSSLVWWIPVQNDCSGSSANYYFKNCILHSRATASGRLFASLSNVTISAATGKITRFAKKFNRFEKNH